MKLTKTQKNFRKQISKLKYKNDEPASYKDHRRTVTFVTEEKKPVHPIVKTLVWIFFMFILPKLISFIIYLLNNL